VHLISTRAPTPKNPVISTNTSSVGRDYAITSTHVHFGEFTLYKPHRKKAL
jgi:hypothetical protein